MPGSYPDPSIYANEAIQVLKQAYHETPEPRTKSLILKAIDAISQLKEEITGFSRQRISGYDSYEFDDTNTAV